MPEPEPNFPDYVPTVPQMIQAGTERYADRDCVVTPEARITYRELDEWSMALAARLVAAGVGKSARVGILFPNGIEWVLAWAATARIGAVVVPINTFYKTPELKKFLRHSDIQYVLGVDRFLQHDYVERLVSIEPELGAADRPPLHLSRLPQLRRVLLWGDSPVPWAEGGYGIQLDRPPDATMAEVVRGLEEDVTPSDVMLVTYTSGSTGEPKGVVHSHGALVRHGRNMAIASGDDETSRVWSCMPLCWVGGFAFVMLRTLSVGGCFLSQAVLDAGSALPFLEKERATSAAAWPEVIKSLAAHPDFRQTDLSSLRSGPFWDALPIDARPPDQGLVVNSLGMSETGGPHTYRYPGEDVTGAPEAYRGTFGHQVPGTEHRIVDPDTGADVAPGEEGEVLVRGYSLMQGLYKKERDEVFDADGWYHTGDRGLFRDGWFFFTGRHSALIKTAGSNVAPGEVEAALLAMPEVRLAFVAGVPHPVRGQDVVALVVADPELGQEVDGIEIRDRLRDQLSSYKVPRQVFLISPADVPWLVSQKVDRREVQAMAEKLAASANPPP